MARGKAARASINTLPDEILVDIISLLTCTDEAVRTCAISKRWRDLWKHVNRISFITNDNHYMKGGKRYPLTIQNVNQVLESHQCESLDEFKIHYPLMKADMKTRAFDKWLKFAMSKGVRQLDIDLDGKYYHFRYKSTATKIIFQSPGDDDRLVFPKFLKHLSLNCINIGDNIVEQILSNCPFLEHLRVSGSAGLNDLRVVGSSLQLKFLQISDCLCLSSVEIFAPNLKSFVYDEIAKLTVLNHAPELVNVSLGEQDMCIHRAFGAVANYSSQLETLNLNINFHNSYYAYERCKFPAFSELTRLQELSLTFNMVIWRPGFLDLNRLTCLVERSPSLRKFTLEVRYMERYMERWGKRLVGFVVSTSDTKIAMCLLECANSLMEEFEEDADLFKENFEKCIAGRPSKFETNLMIHMPTCFKRVFKSYRLKQT